MPFSQIAVEIVIPDTPPRRNSQGKNPVEAPELRRALLQACSDTVQVAVCVNADSARRAAALALVFWRGNGRVRIEVGSKDAPGGQTWTSREIEFSPSDAPIERWRAAGYAAGTLASLLVRGGHPPGEDAATQPSGSEDKRPPDVKGPGPAADSTGAPQEAGARVMPVAKPKTEPVTGTQLGSGDRKADLPSTHRAASLPTAAWRWSLDALGALGPGISPTVLNVGGLARVNLAFGGPFVTVSMGYSEEQVGPEGFSARWFLPAGGVGYVKSLGAGFTSEARAEFVTELVEAHASGRPGEESWSSRWLLGGRIGAALAWGPIDSIALLLGGAASARGPATDVVVRNEVRATAPILAYQLEGGLRLVLR